MQHAAKVSNEPTVTDAAGSSDGSKLYKAAVDGVDRVAIGKFLLV
jgi:hypothetical protein